MVWTDFVVILSKKKKSSAHWVGRKAARKHTSFLVTRLTLTRRSQRVEGAVHSTCCELLGAIDVECALERIPRILRVCSCSTSSLEISRVGSHDTPEDIFCPFFFFHLVGGSTISERANAKFRATGHCRDHPRPRRSKVTTGGGTFYPSKMTLAPRLQHAPGVLQPTKDAKDLAAIMAVATGANSAAVREIQTHIWKKRTANGSQTVLGITAYAVLFSWTAAELAWIATVVAASSCASWSFSDTPSACCRRGLPTRNVCLVHAQ